MGRLEPGAQYIYERVDGKVYARKVGAHPGDRLLIGYDYDGSGKNLEQGLEQLHEDRLWAEIRRAAKTNTALQDALDRVKVVYELSKDNNEPPGWHPV
jgi:hypothetical protein